MNQQQDEPSEQEHATPHRDTGTSSNDPSAGEEEKDIECSVFDETEQALFVARLKTLRLDEIDTFLESTQNYIELTELREQVQKSYDQNHPRLVSEVALRERIEKILKFAADVCKVSRIRLRLTRAFCSDYLTNREAFRNYMKSRLVRRGVAELVKTQLEAKQELLEMRIAMFLLLSDRPTDDYRANSFYMSTVLTFFFREYKRYGHGILTPEPSDDDIHKLSSLVSCMSFHSVRSPARLLSHIHGMTTRLGIFEQKFLDNWHSTPLEDVDKISWELALLNDVIHSTRRTYMMLMSCAMELVHDEESDRFFQFCRYHEDRIASEADTMYHMEERLKNVSELIMKYWSTEDPELNARSFPVTTDPVERTVGRIDQKSIPGSYDVFVGHDGTHDSVILAKNIQSEMHERGYSCYSESELNNEFIPFLSDTTERALHDTCVGVFLLTPELAKKKSKVAQLRIMLRRVREARAGWPGVVLIPVFYKLSVTECRYSKTLGEPRETENTSEDTNDGAGGNEPVDESVREARQIFKDITAYTGIENIENAGEASPEDPYGMNETRFRLVHRTTDAVSEACLNSVVESINLIGPPKDEEGNREHVRNLKELEASIKAHRGFQHEALSKAKQNVGTSNA